MLTQRTDWLRPLENLYPQDAALFGQKAVRLGMMIRAGLAVPPGVALSAEASRAHRLSKAQAASMRLPSMVARCLDEAHAMLGSTPGPLQASVQASGASPVLIVRSSSLLEDDESQSAAGLFHSQADVTSLSALYEAVQKIWSQSETALSHVYGKHHRRQGPDDTPLIIQRQVESRLEGVLFSVNPTTGNGEEWVIQLSHRRATDRVGVVTSGAACEQVVYWNVRTGLISDVVSTRSQLLLSEDQLNEILEKSFSLQQSMGHPLDIEFAVDTSQVWFVQSRPVTGPRAHSVSGVKKFHPVRNSIVWTQANVGEALWGPVTPLTWSVLYRFSAQGFDTLLSTLGCTAVSDSEKVSRFRGRVYLNMTALAQSLTQIPGMDISRLQSLGGGHLPITPEEFASLRQPGDPTKYVLRSPWVGAKALRHILTLSTRWRQHRAWFESEWLRLSEVKLSLLPLLGLDRVLMNLEILLSRTGNWLLEHYAYLLMQTQGLRWLSGYDFSAWAIQRHDASRPVSLALGGELALLAQHLREANNAQDVEVRKMILETDPSKLRIQHFPPCAARSALENFFQRFGHRAVRETELAVPRWREDPSWVWTILRTYLVHAPMTEPAVDRSHPSSHPSLHPSRATRWVQRYLDKWFTIREEVRDDVVRTLGLMRAVALEISARLEMVVEKTQSHAPVFFLSVEEIHAFLRNQVGAHSLGERIAARAGEFKAQASRPELPSTFRGWAEVLEAEAQVVSGTNESRRPVTFDPSCVGRGLPVSAGVAEGPARVMRDIHDLAAFKPGEVLVVPQADVGWTALFPMAKAVVTELGGPLSHAGIIAREHGLPAVFNVRHATALVKDGERIRVDGYEGTFRRCD